MVISRLFHCLTLCTLACTTAFANEHSNNYRNQFSAQETSVITWAVPNWPPFFILQGPLAGLGISDGRLKFMQNKLNNYKHINLEMNFSRFFKQAAKYQNLCMVDLLKQKKRQQWVNFSMPIAVTLPPELIVTKEMQKQWQLKDEVSLAKLLRLHNKKVIFESGRAYGQLEQVIQNHLHLPQVRKSPINTQRLTSMLFNNRVDYMVEYPYAAYAIAKAMGRSNEIQTLTISEQPRYLTAHVACTNNLWGQKVIRNINQVIKAYGTTQAYRKASDTVLRFLPPKDQHLQKHIYNEVFLPLLRKP